MGVIALPNIQPQGSDLTDQWQLRSLSARRESPLNGVATTLERPGSHWSVSPKFYNLDDAYRARMQQFLANCRGYANRFYVPLYGWTRRGSFPATELLTNNTFASTTGWSVDASTLSVQDNLIRAASAGTAQVFGFLQSTIAVTQYAPYAMRAALFPGRVNTAALRAYIHDGIAQRDSSSVTSGLATVAVVPPSATLTSAGVYNNGSGEVFGNYFESNYVSLARCALVCNRPNLLLQSDDFTTTWTNVRSSDASNLTTAPDGTLTADSIIEDATASNTHYIEQSVTVAATVLDYAFSVALKADALGWANLALSEGTGSTECSIYFNISTGALGTIATGANWANVRAFTKSLGNGWYHCTIVARKTNAATALTARIYLAVGDGTASYNGDGVSRIFAWRATLAQSSVPTRLSLTTISATTGTSQTGGALHLKGLPASTSGLLVAGDPVEIITGTSSQLARVRTSLDSDALGIGYLEFEAPIRVSPSDNAAVIVQNPLCRMMLDSPNVEWSEHSGGFSDIEFSAVEDTYP